MAVRESALENLVDRNFWAGRRVFLTGHTGFKGGWLALWLNELGADVTGYALPPATTPDLFTVGRVAATLASVIGDIRDAENLNAAIRRAQPEIIFHLAAQALVGEGYRDPVSTYTTNFNGTLNILEAARSCSSLKALIVVTTDKCYENREALHALKETDPLGGSDPYASSKAAAELVTAAYRESFFASPQSANVATVRAGNVIGGGDWSANRLVPDLLRAFSAGEAPRLRAPRSIRPWQHVLEPLKGYLMLAERLHDDASFSGAWNFGPVIDDCISAAEIAEMIATCWGHAPTWEKEKKYFPHEAKLLLLDSSAARSKLNWQPTWSLPEALHRTVSWHQAWLSGRDMQSFCREQINEYANSKPLPDEP